MVVVKGVGCTISSTTVWLAEFRNVVYKDDPELMVDVTVTWVNDELGEDMTELEDNGATEVVETEDEDMAELDGDGVTEVVESEDEDKLLLEDTPTVEDVKVLDEKLVVEGGLGLGGAIVEFKVLGKEEVGIDVVEAEKFEVKSKVGVSDGVVVVEEFERKGLGKELAGNVGLELPLPKNDGAIKDDEEWGPGGAVLRPGSTLAEGDSVLWPTNTGILDEGVKGAS